jgi:indolepyruvate ferredoxin oxidoreductase alpha subunit
MTGGQMTLATGDELTAIIKGLGVKEEHIKLIVPLSKNHDENVRVIREEMLHPGLSVIISRRKCVQI